MFYVISRSEDRTGSGTVKIAVHKQPVKLTVSLI